MAYVEPGTAAKRQASGGAYYYETAEAEERAWVAWLVPGFVLACVGVFVAEMYVNNCPAHPHPLGSCVAGFLHRFSFQPTRQNPLLGPSSSTLEKMGALEWNRVVHHNQGWRLLSCVWLHAGLIHLIVNMLSLIFVGIRLEQQFGFVRIGTVYILSGFGGAVLSALLLRNNISVGASGALFGLLGSMLSELIINWAIYSNRIAALLTLMVIIVINLVIGLFPSVDNFAHIGGFLSGFLLGFVLLIRPQFGWMERHDLPPSAQVTSKYKAYQCVLWVLGLILLIAGFAVGLIMLFRGVNGNDHCHWCHYLNCVPTSSWSCEN
ncbi:RHOMBOID-like protein 3 [Curcuma longa]|uniref:RHOMBOID-like protein 3 n=1 Tax=Curcuma longa TaxID=136217 RepID=UPI003D9F1AFA